MVFTRLAFIPPSAAMALLAATFALCNTPANAQESKENPDQEEIANAFRDGVNGGELDCPLDPLGTIPSNWDITPDTLDQLFGVPQGVKVKKNPYFSWLTTIRDRALFTRQPYDNLTVDLSFFDKTVPVEEVIVDFLDGKLNGITISVFNRGDASEIASDEFDRRMKACGSQMSRQLEVRPVTRKANPTQGLLTEGWTWISENGMAILEYNPEALTGSPEFLRMRLAPRDTKGAFAAAMRDRSSAVKLSDLPRNVVREGDPGDVYIKGIPMVDQGPKGYCVAATCQRLFEYYGIPCDQHQIAQIAGTDVERGTSSAAISQSLERIDYRFKTRFEELFALMTDGQIYEIRRGKPSDVEEFEKQIMKSVDEGIPLLWSLELGKYPEEPAISQQASGGHMRMVIGYNTASGKLIFSDTWGAGHEMKRMTMENAFKATYGLYVMKPTVR